MADISDTLKAQLDKVGGRVPNLETPLGDIIDDLNAGANSWTVATILARNAIQVADRTLGMLVYVQANGNTYTLRDGLTDADWEVALWGLAASSTTELYVNNVTGSDDNAGTSAADALRTHQAAVNKLLPPHLPAPYWAWGENRTIYTAYTGTAYTDMLDIPPHRGEGALILQGEENVIQEGLAQSGALAAVSGTKTQSTLTFTGATLTANAYDQAAFVRPTTRESVEATIYDACFEDAPVLVNSTSSMTIVLADPGVYTGFAYGDGMAFDLVAPQVQWGGPDNDPGGFEHGPVITNRGGGLILQGYVLAGGFRPILSNAAPIGSYDNAALITTCVVNRCRLSTGTFAGGGLSLVGTIGAALKAVDRFTAWNTIALRTQGLKLRGCTDAALVGVVFANTGALVSDGLTIEGSQYVSLLYFDVQKTSLLVSGSQSVSLTEGSVLNAAGNACVKVRDGSQVSATALVGTTGNTDVGVLIDNLSTCVLTTTSGMTLSGTAGNVRTGAGETPNTYATPTTHAASLSRFDS